jgi:hypothetical protein
VFAGQAEQNRLSAVTQLDAPANEYKPVTHFEQFPRLDAPTKLEDVPAGHFLHVLAPDVLEYLPAMQFVHEVADVLAAN